MTAILKASRSPHLRVSAGRHWSDADVAEAVVRTVAYADIFDYPLTPDEIHRYLIGIAVSREAVRSVLESDLLVPGVISRRGEFFMLRGREPIVDVRREREQRAADLWPHAVRYGRMIASSPFVQMVAVTGELPMDNVGPESDIDYFIVTEHGRLWLCRAFVLMVVRAAARAGIPVCPNYLLSDHVLELQQCDLYAAHEIVQMVPIAGLDTYMQFRQANRWVFDHLPNAVAAPRYLQVIPHARPLRALAECSLRSPLGAVLERWEQERKVRKLCRAARAGGEASFTADWCKGHYHNHGHQILDAFATRLQTIDRAGS